ncbi:hypothetical protein MTO96_012718 [Rhipicephalus appendiculatus]
MDLTITISADGSPDFNSSKFSIWPLQVIINELSPGLRSKNVAVSMLWYGQSHPEMSLVLEAFAKQMETLAETVADWTCDGETYNSKVQLSILSLAHLNLTGQKKEHYKTSKKHTGLELMFEE